MDFIDPESLKIAFRVRNNDATLDLNPGTQEPSCFITRVQLFANGRYVCLLTCVWFYVLHACYIALHM